MNDRLDLHDMKYEQMVVFASDPYFEAMRRLQCFGDAVRLWCRLVSGRVQNQVLGTAALTKKPSRG